MNPWADLLITVLVRLTCGFALGAVASFVVAFRWFMRAIATEGFPAERVMLWGSIGAVLCVLTTPRDTWPWSKG